MNLIIGDVLDGLRSLESNSVDCVVTSPPYWNLRNYGVAGQIGAAADSNKVAHITADLSLGRWGDQ